MSQNVQTQTAKVMLTSFLEGLPRFLPPVAGSAAAVAGAAAVAAGAAAVDPFPGCPEPEPTSSACSPVFGFFTVLLAGLLASRFLA